MKLKEIVIHNFMPYKGEQKIVFPQHETQNVMLLFGDNMRGKTSFLNAIRWGFYGRALGRHLRAIPRINLVNIEAVEEGDCTMSIVLKFSDSNKDYELRRTIERKSHVSQPKSDSEFNEVVGLKIDGEVITGDIITNEINKVIPEEISRFFLFDGELLQEYENLLIEGSEQGEKIKEHIEQVLGVPALIHGREEFIMLLKDARRIQTKDAKKSSDLKSYAEQQRQLEIKRAALEKDSKDLLVQQENTQKEVELIDDALKNTEAVQRKKIDLERLASELRSTENNLLDLADEKRGLLQTAWKDMLFASVEPILQQLKDNRDDIQNTISNKAIIDFQIADLAKILDDPICTTCEQGIPKEQIQPIRKKFEMLKAESELTVVNMDSVAEINGKIDKLSKIKSADEGRRILSVIKKQRTLQTQQSRIETQLDDLEEEIKGFDTDKIMRQRDKRDRLIAQQSRIDQDVDKCKHCMLKNEKEQDHIATLISKSAGAKGQLSSIRVNMYQELEQVFSKGIDYLRDALRTEVAGYASKAFAELTTEKTYSGLDINENYGLSIRDQDGRVLNERSAGAEQIVALSLIDGLNRTAQKSAPIIMDTPLGRLDPKHRHNVLRHLPNMADQVVLLVHEGEINLDRDISVFADRIGARYQIERISATESRIVRSN